MNTHTPLALLAALGLLSIGLPAAAAPVDTSQWKCESCPFPEGTSSSVEAGLGATSGATPRFGDYTGLDRNRAHLVLGGNADWRAGGRYASVVASELGLDRRSLAAEVGAEGSHRVTLRYSELPRHLAEGAATPFLGVGSGVLTLPAGYPAGSTAGMPLAGTLNDLDLGYTLKRFDLGGTLIGDRGWTYRVSLRRDTRDGTRAFAGSFFSTTSQLPMPVDQTTDQFEVAAAYAGRRLQASLAYQVSQFRNGVESLTWDNPFTPVLAGSTRGQMALAPDNQFHQIVGSAGYALTPKIRVSADFAVGRSTQDASYLASTLNAGLLPGTPALPAASLDGSVHTFNGSVRVTATPIDGLRLNASVSRDVRDNRTESLAYPTVVTDLYVDPTLRGNTPFSFWNDRVRLAADWRGPGSLKLAGGYDHDARERNYSEVVTTRESTVWGRASVQALENVTLALKLSHAERRHTPYGVATWFSQPENPLLRKYNLAARTRDSGGVRADVAVSEQLSVGLAVDVANDDYSESVVGLQKARSINGALDVAYALSDATQITAYLQGERLHARQANGAPVWTATSRDRFQVLGVGVRHAAIPDKLDVGADLSTSRSASRLALVTGTSDPGFPDARTALDTVRLFATYKLSDTMTLTGSYAYEDYSSRDWHLDGVLPATVGNLLAFGQQSPDYRAHLVRVAVRYRF
jgi:MtrB/PioB family decaheme-associated outer membrane protein